MRKKLFVLFVVVAGLFACDKEENAAKDVVYTLDEEFLNNDLNWFTAIYLDSNNRDEEKRKDTSQIFAQRTADNGVFSIETYATSKKNLSFYLDAKPTVTQGNTDFVVESLVSWTSKDKTVVFTGLVWDHSDNANYFYFGVDANGDYKIGEFSGNRENVIAVGFGTESSSYKLKVLKQGESVYYLVNDTYVDTIPAHSIGNDFNVGIFGEEFTNATLGYLRAGQL